MTKESPNHNNHSFSSLQRNQYIQDLKNQEFDLLVIGGGITGVGIALDAATRGYKTALIEKRDFAWGTSSRSTKLIHGGLRYLKQLEFGLVHEVGVERAIVHNNARHVVIPERMLLPIIEKGSLGKRLSSIGLWIYDRLANVAKDERRKMYSKEKIMELEPLVRTDILKGGGLYYEYRTDDARLTIETAKTAVANGATCLNYAKAVEFLYKEGGWVRGAKVKDTLSGEIFDIKARRVVNATGPWVDKLRAMDTDGVKEKRLHLTKGVHIVVPRERLPIQQSVYFDVEQDSRMVFAIPRFGVTYIGTTDTTYGEDINRPIATREDVDYILAAANYMFPTAKLTVNDVDSTWAGLRPLIHQDGKSPSELSRRDELFYATSGLISIAGGKLTGYRKMAERVVNYVAKTLKDKRPCKTKDLPLGGGDFRSDNEFELFIEKRAGEAKQILVEPVTIARLAYRYGKAIDIIIDKAFELYPTIKDPRERIVAAELWYGINYEMVNNLNDFLIRRTGRLYFDRPELEKIYPLVADQMQEQLGWTDAQRDQAVKSFEQEYFEVVNFKN
ncbi:MAG: glycerol-3-phosphate dehydrogenase/oxidase [Saprospiraceae bacterium]|nr:glycerol-3-phosphate dehydrogenase/oxidase [Saprospiraceae bacterium]